MGIHIGDHFFAWPDIQAIKASQIRSFKEPQYKSALLFCQAWLKGQQTFDVHTSGSTGKPRKFIAKRSRMEASALTTIQTLGLNRDDHFLVCMSMESIASRMSLVRAMMLEATASVVIPSSSPLDQLANNHPYTFGSFVPLQLFETLTNTSAVDKLSLFKQVLIGGSNLNAQLEQTLSHCSSAIYHTYGMTETLGHIALRRIGKEVAFRPLKGITLKIDNRNCLCIKGKVTGNLWLISNDVVELTNNSFIVLARADEIINTGGVKVSPRKVEDALEVLLPGVALFVSSIKDKKSGEKVIAVIESQPLKEKKINEIHKALQKKLRKYEVPKDYFFFAPFSKTNTGKIDKKKTLSELGLL